MYVSGKVQIGLQWSECNGMSRSFLFLAVLPASIFVASLSAPVFMFPTETRAQSYAKHGMRRALKGEELEVEVLAIAQSDRITKI